MQLEEIIKQLIAKNGDLTVAQFMELALFHETHGYYTKKDPFGSQGDFITAPEISQMFGEMVGVWVADKWHKLGSPSEIILAELGPGRGTLMADLLRATAHVKSLNGQSFHEAIEIHLVETSPHLRQIQQQKIREAGFEVSFHSQVEKIPEKPIIFLANEFFDALPVHQFVRTLEGWRERLVTVKESKFSFILSEDEGYNDELVPKQIYDLGVGSIYEVCPAAVVIMSEICRRITQKTGAALIIDYGYAHNPFRDSLQALKSHKFHDFLDSVGDADLTSHVNFSLLREVAKRSNLQAEEIVTQGEFLQAMGIELRAAMLSKQASEKQRQDISSALKRLISAEQMGNLFKVLAVGS